MNLSVIIPTYDTAEMTLACCASVMSTLPCDAEVIVVDDGSADDSARRIGQAFPSLTVLRQPVNRGYAAAVNAGVTASRGELVLLLNSDTRVVPGALEAMVAAFADASLGVAGAQLVNADGSLQWSAGPVPTMLWLAVMVSGVAQLRNRFSGGTGSQPVPSSSREPDGLRARPSSRGVGWVSGAAMMFRSRVWDVAGPLREDFLFYAQDLDFCIRARRAGWNVRLLTDARIEHRHGATIACDNALPYAPEMLWSDLLQWGRGEYGDAWARRARRAMLLAAIPRCLFSRHRAAFRRGYEALRKSPS